MKGNGRDRNFILFLIASGVLCLLYCILFRPITWEAQGDFPSYLDLARQIFHLPGATDVDQSHRSPLYSIVLGAFLIIFGEPHYLVALMVFQYILIFFSSLFIYRIILQLTGKTAAAFIAGLAGVLNLTVIFFGFMILSETLALVLFTALAWLLVKYSYVPGPATGFGAGIMAGLLILARFNMIGLPLVVVFLLILLFIFGRPPIRLTVAISDVTLFAAGDILITGIWSARNYFSYGKFEVIPKHHTGQRWAVPATIDSSDRVSVEYQQVLDIFLRTREELVGREVFREYRKSSLLRHGLIKKINDYFSPDVSGYLLYRDSEDELLALYQLPDTPEGIRALNEKLKPFYREIAAGNKGEIVRLRVYSFLYSFKHVSPTLPGDEPVNLNHLPSWLLQLYKIALIMTVVLTYAGSVAHMIYLVFKKERLRKGLQWVMMYGLIWYFPVINTYVNVLGDANRFRFPADMLIIGLFAAMCYSLWKVSANPKRRDDIQIQADE